jgi:hypothetical protein
MLLVWGIVRLALALRLLLVPGIGVVAAGRPAGGRGNMIKGQPSAMGGKL